MHRRIIVLGAFFALVASGLVATSASAAKPAPSSALSVPIGGSGPTSSFAGTFTATRFTTVDGVLSVVGTLSGTLTNTATQTTSQVNQQVTLPVSQANGTCQILDLTLGPLDLNLLGLMVHLDQVHLTIDAQSGPGNLLGNLLCGIAGLLDGNAGPNTLAGVLNQLLRLL